MAAAATNAALTLAKYRDLSVALPMVDLKARRCPAPWLRARPARAPCHPHPRRPQHPLLRLLPRRHRRLHLRGAVPSPRRQMPRPGSSLSSARGRSAAAVAVSVAVARDNRQLADTAGGSRPRGCSRWRSGPLPRPRARARAVLVRAEDRRKRSRRRCQLGHW